MSSKHVLVLTPYQYGHAPGPRSSLELWERVLKSAGIELHYAPFETDRLRAVLHRTGHYVTKSLETAKAYVAQLARTRRAREFNAVVVYREAALIGPALLERLAARSRPLIYVIDDPLYIPYRSPFSGYLSYLKFFGKVRRICRLSRVVIVNSSHHFEYASLYSHDVRLIPSVVDGEQYYRRAKGQATLTPSIGWTGSVSTIENLRTIENPLRTVERDCAVQLHFIGPDAPPFEELSCTTQPWRAETEVEDLRQIDIGILPLPINEWNRRKFYLKLVQYMALGIPAVCTPLGSNTEILEHGVTGFLANGDNQWVHALRKLVDDENLRESMGTAAAAVARENFTLEANADRIVSAFGAAVG
jgi:glycosyltransferase involved in cell wall biosynthesis